MEEDLVIYSSRTSWVKSRLMGVNLSLCRVYAILGDVFVSCQENWVRIGGKGSTIDIRGQGV